MKNEEPECVEWGKQDEDETILLVLQHRSTNEKTFFHPNQPPHK